MASKANPFTSPLTRGNVRQQAFTSLDSLKTSCMDIFYLHAPDHNTPLEETLGAVQQLYEGKGLLLERDIVWKGLTRGGEVLVTSQHMEVGHG